MGLDGMTLRGFDGRVAVVTGGGRGIGRAIAEGLAAQGATVAAFDLSAEPSAPVPEGMDLHQIRCDVADEASVDAAFTEVEERWGAATILVNNAGILVSSTVHEMDIASWERTMAVNATGTFLCSRRVLPGMQEAGYGRIVSIGSSAGKTGGARLVGAYGASKAAVMVLAKAIASENAGMGITSNALAPTLIDTDMVAGGGLSDLASKIPVGRLGTVDDVAYAVLFLASADAGYITGEVMDVNGGFLID